MIISGGKMAVINPLLFLCGFKIELILKVKGKKGDFAFPYFFTVLLYLLNQLILTDYQQ